MADFHLDREVPFFTGVTVREVLAETCSVCGAKLTESCGAVGGFVTGTHKPRIEKAQATKKAKKAEANHDG